MAFGKQLISNDSTKQNENVLFKINRVKFVNDNGFFVIEGSSLNHSKAIVTGVSQGLSKDWEGREIQCEGLWQEDEKWGKQFKVSLLTPIMPKSVSSLEIFFANKVDGIGNATIKKLGDIFQDSFLNILEEHPEKLLEHISEEKVEDLFNYWKKEKFMFDIKTELSKHGLGENQIAKVYKVLKEETLGKIKKDPYCIINIDGIGFKIADKMALSMGFAKDNPFRIRAALYDYIKQTTNKEGSILIKKDGLLKDALNKLGSSKELIQKCYDNLIVTTALIERKINDIETVSIGTFAQEEKDIASNIKRLITSQGCATKTKIFNKQLDVSQINASQGVWKNKVSIITGGPGTGKTTIIKEIIQNAKNNNFQIQLLAPTGKAAKRMEEATGVNSSTVHRKLKSNGTGFAHNEKEQLHGDVFIIDEFSMMDTSLTCALLKAIPRDAYVLFVGDADQLPSVGPGEVFRNFLDSDVLPVFKLQFTHRQAKGSGIAEAANKIINGILPEIPDDHDFDNDFTFIESSSNEEIFNNIFETIKMLEMQGISKNDIQVLSPQKNELVGVDELNENLKYLFNEEWKSPLPPEWKNLKINFRIGDRAMQLKNNYELELYNGDVGYIKEIFPNKAIIEVDNKEYIIKGEAMNDLSLSYAFTVHKSQGSEAPYVIMPISRSHRFMLNKNIIYTAVTRAKKKFVMVGEKEMLASSLKQEKRHERNNGLSFELENIFKKKFNPII